MKNIYKDLFQKELINSEQFQYLESIRTNKIISLYYELRISLYIGILLLTGGLGYLVYLNLGEIGHLVSILLLLVSATICFHFINKFSQPYSKEKVIVSPHYFDYLVILASLLVTGILTYLLVYYNLTELLLIWVSPFTALFYFFMAYRYDNKTLLSLGILACCASLGIIASPISYLKASWEANSSIPYLGITTGAVLAFTGEYLNSKGLKKHFKFTYQNFGFLLFYLGFLLAIIQSNNATALSILLLIIAVSLSLYFWRKKEFLFFTYSNICGYIPLTYLVFKLLFNLSSSYVFLTYYFPTSAVLYIIFLTKKKSHFAHD